MRGLSLRCGFAVADRRPFLRRKALTPRGAIHRWGWQAGDIHDQRVMHDNYAVIWDANDGGEELRAASASRLVARAKGAGPETSSPSSASAVPP